MKMKININDVTLLLWVHSSEFGGPGKSRTTHVSFIVDPAFMNISGPPRIVVTGSVIKMGRERKNTGCSKINEKGLLERVYGRALATKCVLSIIYIFIYMYPIRQ